MITSEKKNTERRIFKNIMSKSSPSDRKNVENNVKLYVDYFFKKSKKSKKSKYIGIYWPLKNEIDLRGLREKYALALPRCEISKNLLFCAWDNKKLTIDSEGIPSPDSANELSYKKICMLLIPCLAVDKNLTRLGYGGGYFDRLRQDKNWRAIPCIGVLTSNCLSHDLLTKADWDIPLSGYITEKEIIV